MAYTVGSRIKFRLSDGTVYIGKVKEIFANGEYLVEIENSSDTKVVVPANVIGYA
ncbi:hypothetical protein FN846DRAFT_922046 [Sphaerosporella brunnea]|uniref:Uncharacterized protein n=1 Tax=Sphaerosporella brunnea TaxID=1250544 RepID=A0A5J5EK75_9PEZI|nr:hypothetical protein FN846DRAFT_922046 [Sphaerosporella brunnea]